MKHILLILTFMVVFTSAAQNSSKDEKIVLAYLTSWSTIMPDVRYLTHVNYAFGHVNNTFDGVKIDRPERLRSIVDLKKESPSLRVLLSIGGWGSGRFSEMAADENKRKAFAADCRRVIETFELDGIDLDWEFPGSAMAKISASPDDKANFTLLMRDIRQATGADKLLTLASNAGAGYIDFKAVEPFLDFVNIMTYDMASPPKHHSALYRSEHTGWMCCEESVDAHVKAGLPLNKLVLGVPFYGHGKSGIPNFIDYKNIIKLETYTDNWDDTAKVPYLTDSSGQYLCSYENARSISIKCKYVLDKKMLGMMYWDYDGDDAQGTLRKAVWNSITNGHAE